MTQTQTAERGPEWLIRNARKIDVENAKGTESWDRAKTGADDVVIVEGDRSVGRQAVQLDGEPHETLLVRDGEDYVGACDCEGYMHNSWPCAHLCVLRIEKEMGNYDIHQSTPYYRELVGSQEDSEGLTEPVDAEVIKTTEPDENGVQEAETVSIPDDPSINEDPVEWMPDHFVDVIQGVPTLNRKGYAVMSEKFEIEVTSQPLTLAETTDFEFATFSATAIKPDGTKYSGIGSAHVDRGDGDGKYLLNELAETRAMKRAASWATGLGMTAKEEMENDL